MAKTLTVYLAADLKKFNSGMDRAGNKLDNFSGGLKNKLGPALAVAGAAAGAFALKLAKDGVQAAIEDEKAVAQLANTLGNLNLAHDTTAVEAYIYELERAYGVADTDLRPAYERLVRSTKDTEEANRALKIAMDVAAGTGQSLKTVTDSLGRAFDGQTSTLARLGTGIDKTTLSTASMDEILRQLSVNFSGSADQAANTFEGRMGRLKTATDNLAEAFGAGLLDSLNETTEGTQDAVDAMEDLEPILRDIGKSLGDVGGDLAYVAGLMGDLASQADAVTDNMGPAGSAVDNFLGNLTTSPLERFVDYVKELRGEVTELAGDFAEGEFGGGNFADAVDNSNSSVQAANKLYRDAAVRAERLNNEVTETTQTFKAGGSAVDRYTEKQQKLLDLYEEQGIALATSRDELIDQIGVLEEATLAVENYASSIQRDLLGGIDLGALYEENFDEQGRQTGKSLLEGFQEQINQAEWFGNVLTAIKAQNADQRLIEQIASLGPEVGGALGQQLLNEGIIPTLNDKFVGVQDTTRELALGLVPEYIESGRLSAIENLNAMAEQFGKDQRKFKKLGKNLGKQLGASFKQQIAKDVRDAVRAVEAAATAARAERVAAAEAEQARITEQAVATAISRLIRNSDQRAGRSVEPVLQ